MSHADFLYKHLIRDISEIKNLTDNMKKLLILLFILFSNITFCGTWHIVVTVSESDAEIYVNGEKLGPAPQTIEIHHEECKTIEVRKIGFLTETRKWCIGLKDKGIQQPNKKEHIILRKDDAYDGSAKTGNANTDFAVEINKKLTGDDAWKIGNLIIKTYIDDIVQTDINTSYLMTAWKVQTFSGKTIRTRIIMKLGNSKPLTYKVKIESQYSDDEKASAKDDEKFKDWDRILKKYENLISEFQSRLGNK